jgi:hypothetical protein
VRAAIWLATDACTLRMMSGTTSDTPSPLAIARARLLCRPTLFLRDEAGGEPAGPHESDQHPGAHIRLALPQQHFPGAPARLLAGLRRKLAGESGTRDAPAGLRWEAPVEAVTPPGHDLDPVEGAELVPRHVDLRRSVLSKGTWVVL